jgi:hypothetical protein
LKKRYAEHAVLEFLESRHKFLKKEEAQKILNKSVVQRTLTSVSDSVAETDVTKVLSWLERISDYIPITSDKELEELIKIMVRLSKERARLNYLYDKPGIELMKRVREGMTKYFIVLSELRAQRKEYIPYWFTDEYWFGDWSRVLLGLSPNDKMDRYGFPDLTAHDFLLLLELELASADSASELEKPMIRLQPIENEDNFLVIPTETAAKMYHIQVDRIMNKSLTLTEWVNDLLAAINLPKKI